MFVTGKAIEITSAEVAKLQDDALRTALLLGAALKSDMESDFPIPAAASDAMESLQRALLSLDAAARHLATAVDGIDAPASPELWDAMDALRARDYSALGDATPFRGRNIY